MKSKKIICSLPGKIALYSLFVISSLILVISVVLAIVANGTELYYKTPDEIKRDISTNRIRNCFLDYAYAYANGYSPSRTGSYNPAVIIYDLEGNILKEYNTEEYRQSDSALYRTYSHNYTIVKEEYHLRVDDGINPFNQFEDQRYIEVSICLLDNQFVDVEDYYINKAIDITDSVKYAVYPAIIIAFIMCIVFFVLIMYSSGRKSTSNNIERGYFTLIPIEIMSVLALGICIFIFAGLLAFLNEIIAVGTYLLLFIALSVLSFIASVLIILGLCSTLAVRIKLHIFKSTSIVCIFCSWIWKKLKAIFSGIGYLISSIPIIWKAIIICAAISLAELFLIGITHRQIEHLLILWFLEKLILIPLILFLIIGLNKLQKAGVAIASGNTDYVIDKKYLWGDIKKHAENLSSISTGMNKAVDERMRSERMKTELITNVSHDIKTPLTSIINYAGLISAEECSNTKITEYSEVLVNQSEKLKKLIEDLVEASKASSGNLDVELVPCDAGTFISQASGEFEEKLSNNHLVLVCNQPDEEVMIMADPRRMWRIFDNLMNNICKYSLENSRVYLTLKKEKNKAVITFKNTSRDELNISPEELMERFVRGDKSRNTEGNGLGLNIASSLTKLQGGELELSIDGDLFKATLIFPLVK